ncbi:hypothetical protein BAMA111019_04305 [Bacillus manliponensis]
MKKIVFGIVLLFSFLFHAGHTEASSSHLIIINKKTNQLAYYNGGSLVRTFKVATGKDRSLTPEGVFPIVSKIKNRPYYSGGIPGGDPRNPLGDRWLGIDARGTYGTTYAIHGNNNENSVGLYVSSGCIRMYNKDVRWLYDQVPLYTNVIITYTDAAFGQIAASHGYAVGGWEQSNGNWYYYVNGVMQTGWMEFGGKWYYMNSSGVMQTGWVEFGGKWYYMNSSGVMQTGWLESGGKWYYMNNSGVMQTGWIEFWGKWYYMNSSGVTQTGWLEFGDKWYYMNSSGVMQTGWININNSYYYFYENGVMAVNTIIDGYQLDENGKIVEQLN